VTEDSTISKIRHFSIAVDYVFANKGKNFRNKLQNAFKGIMIFDGIVQFLD
jgi:hypothetical protein